MQTRLGRKIASAAGVAALLLLGACGDPGSEGAAQRAARNEGVAEQALGPTPNEHAAARAAAQRSGAAQLSRGDGT